MLLHTSATFEHDAIDSWISRCPELEHVISLDEKAYATRAIVGIADLIDINSRAEAILQTQRLQI